MVQSRRAQNEKAATLERTLRGFERMRQSGAELAQCTGGTLLSARTATVGLAGMGLLAALLAVTGIFGVGLQREPPDEGAGHPRLLRFSRELILTQNGEIVEVAPAPRTSTVGVVIMRARMLIYVALPHKSL